MFPTFSFIELAIFFAELFPTFFEKLFLIFLHFHLFVRVVVEEWLKL